MTDQRERINLSPSPKMLRYIDQLVKVGLYGGDKTSVATRFLEEGVRRALETGVTVPKRGD